MTGDETLPELLTVPEAAAILRVPESWLYSATRRGTFPSVRIGRYVRIRDSDIRRWIISGGDPPSLESSPQSDIP